MRKRVFCADQRNLTAPLPLGNKSNSPRWSLTISYFSLGEIQRYKSSSILSRPQESSKQPPFPLQPLLLPFEPSWPFVIMLYPASLTLSSLVPLSIVLISIPAQFNQVSAWPAPPPPSTLDIRGILPHSGLLRGILRRLKTYNKEIADALLKAWVIQPPTSWFLLHFHWPSCAFFQTEPNSIWNNQKIYVQCLTMRAAMEEPVVWVWMKVNSQFLRSDLYWLAHFPFAQQSTESTCYKDPLGTWGCCGKWIWASLAKGNPTYAQTDISLRSELLRIQLFRPSFFNSLLAPQEFSLVVVSAVTPETSVRKWQMELDSEFRSFVDCTNRL